MENQNPNPAEQAAKQALESVRACIDRNKHFLLEAGAGAGKTYSLVHSLRYIIEKKSSVLLRQHQQVACISYTNVASDEIASRIDRHPVIHSSTIHSFCWGIIKNFQSYLRQELPTIEYWTPKLTEVGGVGSRKIDYDEFGRPAISETNISLHHNDVQTLFIKLLEYEKFRKLFVMRYPILLIDEYQDTDKNLTDALKKHFIEADGGLLIGLFGDHWQKIYGNGCGEIEHGNLEVIGKKANFRSVPTIVECLNRIRPDLPQNVKDPTATGFVGIYHTNQWSGTRLTGPHWAGDLPANVAHGYLDTLRADLASQGWNFDPESTKILMLTHRVLAAEMGYSNLAGVFEHNDAFTKKEDAHISYLFDTVEPLSVAYEAKRFGEMFNYLGRRTPSILRHSDKIYWSRDMDRLMELRNTALIGDVIDHLKATKRPFLSEAVERRENEFEKLASNPIEDIPESIRRTEQLRKISYKEVIAGARFVDEKTPFATKHGVKGAEFENVLVIFGRGWNLYNFNQFLEWASNSVPAGKQDSFERNRNLFYVVCSRPIKRLAILFTQELSDSALNTLSIWFGRGNVHALPSL